MDHFLVYLHVWCRFCKRDVRETRGGDGLFFCTDPTYDSTEIIECPGCHTALFARPEKIELVEEGMETIPGDPYTMKIIKKVTVVKR